MKLRLFTDMDRTIIPNGEQLEDPMARQNFAKFCASKDVTLIYVTGRHLSLMQQAISDYQLPEPEFAITDVGTRIYHRQANTWQAMDAWEAKLDQAWHNVGREQILAQLQAYPMQPQEPEKQHAHKISYYVQPEQLAISGEQLVAKIQTELKQLKLTSNIIWSIDETSNTGLLDILPPNADKMHAINFLVDALQADQDSLLFAGDSGNDLQVLASEIPSVLVANATMAVKQLTQTKVRENNNQTAFYQANNQHSLEGNYSAGVMQGVAHFYPELIRELCTS